MILGWSPSKMLSSIPDEWRAGLSDTVLKGTHPGTIPTRFGLIWFSGFRAEDLNVIFYQNMPNLHNWYKSVERKISQKNLEYMLNYLSCSCSKNLSSFWLILKQHWTIKISSSFFLFLAWWPSWLEIGITGHILERGHPRTIPPYHMYCQIYLGNIS
jgi:hypothetical protein